LFFKKHGFYSCRVLRAGGKESQLFGLIAAKLFLYWIALISFINNFARFSAFLFPFLLPFSLVKKLIRFLGNSAIRHWNLAYRVSGLEKEDIFTPRLNTFSLSPKIIIFEREFTSSAFSGLRRPLRASPSLKLFSRAFARHPCGYGGISPLHPPYRQPLLAFQASLE